MPPAMKWLLGGALVLGVVALAIAVVAGTLYFLSPRQGLVFYEKGLAELERGDQAKAVGLFDAALAKRLPDDLRSVALLGRGRGRQALGKSDEALRDFDEAIRRSPGLAAAYAWRGVFFDEAGNEPAAMRDYSAALRLDPNMAGIRIRRGRYYFDRYKMADAIADFGEAIRAEPDNASHYAWRAKAYGVEREDQLALANFETALRLSPTSAWIYLERAKLYQDRKRYPEAVTDYAKAIRLDPANAAAVRSRVLVYHAAERFDEELSEVGEMLRRDPRDEFALEHRALAYAAQGDAARALPAFDDWIRFTQSGKAYDSRERFLKKEGNYGQLLADLRKAVAVGWVQPFDHLRLAWLLATCPEAALRNGKEAVVQATAGGAKDETAEAYALDVLAAAQAEIGKFTEAAATERKALGVQKDNAFLRKPIEDRLALYLRGVAYHEEHPANRAAPGHRE